jgi:hypothetical protein
MTAQIAIMNKNAVAVATDSAVTTRDARGVKVYNSANKLFTLSKYHPVGIMIYANSEFMGYPWETLIKVYRRNLDQGSLPSVSAYADSFFKFLLAQDAMFSPSRQEDWFRARAFRFLSDLNDEFTKVVRRYFDEHGEMDDSIVTRLIETFLVEGEQTIKGKAYLPFYENEAVRSKFVDAASAIVEEAMTQVFQSLPIENFRERIARLTLTRFLTDSVHDYSGIVFVGFGNDEMLPVVDSYWADGIFGGIVRHSRQEHLSGNLNVTPTSWIFPFAQSDTVYRFLQGIDPQYKREAVTFVEALTKQVSDHVHGATSQLYDSDDERSDASNSLGNTIREGMQQLLAHLSSLERERFLSPVMDVIGSLPKEDLAAIAESLVNLTSFQRKILREAETVGGPIDVAVISKGDGFIWIKRKHYFEKDLNPAFFANYYRGDDHVA